MKKAIIIFCLSFSMLTFSQNYVDDVYSQDYADKFELSEGFKNATLFQVEADRNKVVKVVSSEGLLQPWEKQLTRDYYYRPLADMNIVAATIYENQFVYLTDEAVLSNAWAGKIDFNHEIEDPTHFVIGANFSTLIASSNKLVLIEEEEPVWSKEDLNGSVIEMVFDVENDRFLVLTNNAVYEKRGNSNKLSKIYEGVSLTALAVKGDVIFVGTANGFLTLSGNLFKTSEINQKLPATEITSITTIDNEIWFGSTKGAFKLRSDSKFDYYASKRWLVDDEVITISKGSDNSVLILTKTGLSKINFTKMTLADKAAHFQEIMRLRHIRYGLSGELTLNIPGDVSTGALADTDNDGLWTSMYLAAELFRYSVTKSEDAKLNAYEAFEAMERLTEITGLDGFPARTYERDTYEMGMETNGFSEEWRLDYIKKNGRIWRLSEDGKWRWKSNTSSDESAGHFFAYALMAELAPDKEWRDRAIHQIVIEADHLIENGYNLTDWNGESTAWGRFSPEYVNSYPIIVGDRRLNSTLMLAFLQSAYHFTEDDKYKEKAYELIDNHGYEENASSPPIPDDIMKKGDIMSHGVEWNHSDDEMYFLTSPAFVNYSFNDTQKEKHFKAVKSHWEFERSEKNPLWNFLYAMSGGTNIDLDESIWWLKEFPMDLILWNIDNSQRK
ncbi:MAG: hypothetical protein KAG26_04650, partial [Methylococcales bacterium]|nr:hypothetical protein [Methylococcales bacterium]